MTLENLSIQVFRYPCQLGSAWGIASSDSPWTSLHQVTSRSLMRSNERRREHY